MNSPGWIFLDKDQVDDFHRTIVDAEGEDTVDQLGFNLLTNEISERLFPWCSTLTTRARYFPCSAAILDLAIDRIAAKKPKKATGDALGRAYLSEQSAAYQTEIMRLERLLAVSLYAFYADRSGNGIFGSRNLDKIKERQLRTVLSKRLLSLPGRYPNAIYRGGLHSLRLFSKTRMSNTMVVQLSLNGDSAFTPDWQHGTSRAKAEIERLDEFWSDKRPYEKSFLKRCEVFRESAVGKAFQGFKLYAEERELLRREILTISPFLKPLGRRPKKFLPTNSDLDLVELAGELGGDFAHLVVNAGLVNDLISPFRQMYSMIANREETKVKKTKFDFVTIRRAHKELQKADVFFELPAVVDATSPWVAELVSRKGYPNENVIQHLKQRATDIVTARRKVPPHLIDPDKWKSRGGIADELDVFDSSFRLHNASRILRDVFGDGNAS